MPKQNVFNYFHLKMVFKVPSASCFTVYFYVYNCFIGLQIYKIEKCPTKLNI